MKISKIVCSLILALLLLLFACACGRSSYGHELRPSGAAPAASAAPAAEYVSEYMEAPAAATPEEGYTETADLNQSIDGIAVTGSDSERKIITTINLRMESKEYDKSANAIFDAVKAVGGYIEFSDIGGDIKAFAASDVNTFGNAPIRIVPLGAPDFETRSDYYRDGEQRFMSLRIRIPQTNLSGFLSQVEACGNVLSKQESAEDITLQYVDVESHISALTAERDRLLAMLEKAETVEEMIAIETRLSEIRYQLERYESTLRVYKNQISYATVNLTLNEVLIYTEKPETPVTMSERISIGWNQTLRDIANYWKNWFVWFVVNLIYIVPVLICIVVAIIILRKMIRRFLSSSTAKALSAKDDGEDASEKEQLPQESKKKE